MAEEVVDEPKTEELPTSSEDVTMEEEPKTVELDVSDQVEPIQVEPAPVEPAPVEPSPAEEDKEMAPASEERPR